MQILKIKKINLKEIVKLIKQGKVIVCPTDTVYGLIADVTNKKAVEKVFKIKKRKIKKPIPIFIKDLKTAKKIAEIDKKQEKFLRKVWPGKVTVVLKRKKTKRNLYGVDKKTIALRIPRYRLINTLLRNINQPLTGTSANISDRPATTKIKEVLKQLKPDLIIDAGNLKPSKPSKVIDLTSKKTKIIRR